MKRRNFLKGLLAIPVALAAPSLVAKVVKDSDSTLHEYQKAVIEFMSDGGFNDFLEDSMFKTLTIKGLEPNTTVKLQHGRHCFMQVSLYGEDVNYLYHKECTGEYVELVVLAPDNEYSRMTTTLNDRDTLMWHVKRFDQFYS